MIEKIWRYSINNGEFGGIVFADTIESAEEKVCKKYSNKEICIWKMLDDEYFDVDNSDVYECYGL